MVWYQWHILINTRYDMQNTSKHYRRTYFYKYWKCIVQQCRKPNIFTSSPAESWHWNHWKPMSMFFSQKCQFQPMAVGLGDGLRVLRNNSLAHLLLYLRFISSLVIFQRNCFSTKCSISWLSKLSKKWLLHASKQTGRGRGLCRCRTRLRQCGLGRDGRRVTRANVLSASPAIQPANQVIKMVIYGHVYSCIVIWHTQKDVEMRMVRHDMKWLRWIIVMHCHFYILSIWGRPVKWKGGNIQHGPITIPNCWLQRSRMVKTS